jgi:hypothetical protein
MAKKDSKLWEFIANEPQGISYDMEKKKKFRQLGHAFLKSVRRRLENKIEDCRISYNPGGIAVSGDHSLYAVFKNGKGACVFFNYDGIGSFVTFREIKHLKDYSGGMNRNRPLTILSDPELAAEELSNIALMNY